MKKYAFAAAALVFAAMVGSSETFAARMSSDSQGMANRNLHAAIQDCLKQSLLRNRNTDIRMQSRLVLGRERFLDCLDVSAGVLGTSQNEIALHEAMRKLWSDHVIWTRQYITSAVAGSADAEFAASRLLKNQEDIGDAIVPYYGREAGSKLTSLLKDHITIAVDIVAAAKAGDDAKFNDADRRWHDNAEDIATFLSSANPAWGKQAVLTMLSEHLALTTDEAVARLEAKWNDDVMTFDKIYDQSLMMADTLSDGIVKQFPERFMRAGAMSSISRMSSRMSSRSFSSVRNSAMEKNIGIRNFSFDPRYLQVKRGTTVTWTQMDNGTEHTVASDDTFGPMSPLLSQGESYSYTFNEAGTFTYHCGPHPSMRGTIEVIR